ncbi:MAG: NifB/NifX family molybdenum-iron cluster-binding protein [Limnochordia bacterium]
MKIAIPVDKTSLQSKVSLYFGRAPYFLVYDPQSKEGLFVDNDAVASTEGAGIKAAQTIVDHEVKTLLVPRLGANGAKLLKAAGVEIYKTIDASVEDNIDAFLAGELHSLTEIHPGFHGRGGN